MVNTPLSSLPRFWPAQGAPGKHARDAVPTPLGPELAHAESIMGVVTGPDSRAATFVEALLEASGRLRVRLIAALHPACATRTDDLTRLLEIQAEFEGRAAFRVTPVPAAGAMNALCILSEDREATLATGGTPNLGIWDLCASDVNLVQPCDTVLVSTFSDWFDPLWETAAPLTPATAGIPPLVPAEGDPAAAVLWDEFVTACEDAREQAPPSEEEDGRKVTVSVELGVRKRDGVSERVAAVYARGDLVTVQRAASVPPLDAPVRPEYFGVPSLQQVGGIQRRVEYRISVLDKANLRDLEKWRKYPTQLLGRLSYPLSNGIRWIPKAAQQLLEDELERMNQHARGALNGLVTGDVKAFVNSRREQVANDANRMYRDFFPEGKLRDDVLDKMLEDLVSRLERAMSGRFLPQVSYSALAFKEGRPSGWQSPWGQAVVLLNAIAEFPRRVLTDRRYLLGIRVPEERLLAAMDVAEDALLKSVDRHWALVERAREELRLLEDIDQAEVDDERKCTAILLLLTAAPEKEVRDSLAADDSRRDAVEALTEGDDRPTGPARLEAGRH